jgi:hypothetical protein
VARLDAYFRVADVRGDDWSPGFEDCYPEPYWRQYVEPGYEGRWNGLMVRGSADVELATCVFPSDAIVGGLEPGAFLFSEHPLDFAEVTGFHALARASFERMRAAGISFYHVHAPLDMHPEVSPSRPNRDGARPSRARGVRADRRGDPWRRLHHRRERRLTGRVGGPPPRGSRRGGSGRGGHAAA